MATKRLDAKKPTRRKTAPLVSSHVARAKSKAKPTRETSAALSVLTEADVDSVFHKLPGVKDFLLQERDKADATIVAATARIQEINEKLKKFGFHAEANSAASTKRLGEAAPPAVEEPAQQRTGMPPKPGTQLHIALGHLSNSRPILTSALAELMNVESPILRQTLYQGERRGFVRRKITEHGVCWLKA